MSALGNFFWFFLCGIWIALGWFIAGLLLCVTIVLIPFGVQCFKLAGLALLPFGREIDYSAAGFSSCVGNFLWILLFGWEIALVSALVGGLLCITVVGIPFGLQCFKLAQLAFTPFGARIV